MTDAPDIADTLDESMDLSEETKAEFHETIGIQLSPEAVFAIKKGLEHRTTDPVTTRAEAVAKALLATFRQQTADTNTAELTAAQWYHLYGAVYTLAFSDDHEVADDAVEAAADEILAEMPPRVADIMELVGEAMAEHIERHGDA